MQNRTQVIAAGAARTWGTARLLDGHTLANPENSLNLTSFKSRADFPDLELRSRFLSQPLAGHLYSPVSVVTVDSLCSEPH